MNKKTNLLNLFTQDSSYNYHLVVTKDPDGHLLYLIKNGSKLDIETLEFSPTRIAETLVDECNVKIEKIAPSIFFTEETNTEKLRYQLNEKLSETSEFSELIESVKDTYRILEVKDSLLYKKDPEAYEEARRKEHQEKQKELIDELMKQIEDQKKQREEKLESYNNDLVKLLKDYFEEIIEFEKRDFNIDKELENIIGGLIDQDTWIKIEDKPLLAKIEICSLEQNKMNVFLTDNNEYSFTATLKFDKNKLVTENIFRINNLEVPSLLPEIMKDYEILVQIFDIDINSIPEWLFKNDSERFEYIIDYLVPIFKKNKEEKKKEWLKKMKEEGEENEYFEDNDEDEYIDKDIDDQNDEDEG